MIQNHRYKLVTTYQYQNPILPVHITCRTKPAMQVIAKWCSSRDKTNFAKCTSQIFQYRSLHIRDCFMHFQNEVCKFHAQGLVVLFVHIFQHLIHSTVVSCSDYSYPRIYLVGCDTVMS